jgi:hypothetical protein
MNDIQKQHHAKAPGAIGSLYVPLADRQCASSPCQISVLANCGEGQAAELTA